MEGLTDAWNQENINDICKHYGEIVKVKLFRIRGTKAKNFGFITFISRESALACVEGINNSQIGDGEIKVKASIAKLQLKGLRQMRSKISRAVQTTKEKSEQGNNAGSSEMKIHAKSKKAKRKGKMVNEEKGKILSDPEIGGDKPNNTRMVTEDLCVRAASKLERGNHKRKNLNLSARGNGKIGAEHSDHRNPTKKPKGNKLRRQSENFRKPKREPYIRKEPEHGAEYKNRRAPGYSGSTVSHHNHANNTISGYKRPYADMEPHAGYIVPVARKQGRTYSEYLDPPVRIQHQPRAGYLQHAVGTQSQPHIGFREPASGSHGRPHGGYLEPALGIHSLSCAGYLESAAQRQVQSSTGYLEPAVQRHGQSHTGYLKPAAQRHGQSHAGYSESALGKLGHNTYDLALTRAGGQDALRGGHSAYRPGYSLPPSYDPNYTSYAGYEGGSSVGVRYQGIGERLTRRPYL